MTRTVIFDVGNVLIQWDIRRLYRQFLPDEAQIITVGQGFVNEGETVAPSTPSDAPPPCPSRRTSTPLP